MSLAGVLGGEGIKGNMEEWNDRRDTIKALIYLFLDVSRHIERISYLLRKYDSFVRNYSIFVPWRPLKHQFVGWRPFLHQYGPAQFIE